MQRYIIFVTRPNKYGIKIVEDTIIVNIEDSMHLFHLFFLSSQLFCLIEGALCT